MASLIEPGEVIPYEDLRDFIQIVDQMGELRRADGVDQYLEIGALSSINREQDLCPATLCDRFEGLEPGFRLLLNPTRSLNRMALCYTLPLGLTPHEYGQMGVEKGRDMKPIPPNVVKDGPVLENVQEGDRIDLSKFPRPWWHDKDGGAYIGTAVAVVTRDPDSDWVNVGTYRVMYVDPTHVSVYISPDGHGLLHRDRWFTQGKPCPVAICVGADPRLFLAATNYQPEGVCEYEYMGALQGKPIDVIIEPHTGLPIPARAEIVIAGEFVKEDVRPEGPFGEVFGYYASGVQEHPAVAVQAVYHRNDPIMLGNPPGRPAYDKPGPVMRLSDGENFGDLLRKLVSGVKDVYSGWSSASGQVAVISIEQQFPGHSMQAGLTVVNRSGHRPRYVIVVDDDVDIRNPTELLWAVVTRTDPIKDIHIIPRTASSPTEPSIPPWEGNLMSRCILDATRPYEWIDKFPPTVDVPPEVRERVMNKFAQAVK